MKKPGGVIPIYTPILVTDVVFSASAGIWTPVLFSGTLITIGSWCIICIAITNSTLSVNAAQLFMTIPFGIVQDFTVQPGHNFPVVYQSNVTAGAAQIGARLASPDRIRFTRMDNSNWLAAETHNFGFQIGFKKV